MNIAVVGPCTDSVPDFDPSTTDIVEPTLDQIAAVTPIRSVIAHDCSHYAGAGARSLRWASQWKIPTYPIRPRETGNPKADVVAVLEMLLHADGLILFCPDLMAWAGYVEETARRMGLEAMMVSSPVRHTLTSQPKRPRKQKPVRSST